MRTSPSKEDKINDVLSYKQSGNAIMETQSEIVEDGEKGFAMGTYLLRMLFLVRNGGRNKVTAR
jgi:hypothetical protein